jgi:tryptophanyl-tRNA synthetase
VTATITYEPDRRPEVSNLVLVAALCQERSPEAVAAEIDGDGEAGLKRVLAEAVNERFRRSARGGRSPDASFRPAA